MRRPPGWSHVACAVCAIPATVAACGSCVFSLTEPLLPPVVPWSIAAIPAYLAVSLFVRPTGGRFLPLLYHPFTAIVLAVSASLGSAVLGPLPLLALLALAIVGIVSGIVGRRFERPRSRRWALAIGAVLSVALLVTGVRSTVQELRRDDVDRILRWSGTSGARSGIDKLLARKDRPSLRRLVASDDPYGSARAARALGKLGVPAIDAPLILNALRHAEARPKGASSYEIGEYVAALEALFGQKPAMGNSAKDWEALLTSS